MFIQCTPSITKEQCDDVNKIRRKLLIWYPILLKPTLATLVHLLMKLVMTINEKYSSTAASTEFLAEGMESTWMMCIGSEIHRLIANIFFQIECKSSPSPKSIGEHHDVPASIMETLETLLRFFRIQREHPKFSFQVKII